MASIELYEDPKEIAKRGPQDHRRTVNIPGNFPSFQAMSPDGEAIVTGAGDETLRFWHVFSKSEQHKTARSKLNLFNTMR